MHIPSGERQTASPKKGKQADDQKRYAAAVFAAAVFYRNKKMKKIIIAAICILLIAAAVLGIILSKRGPISKKNQLNVGMLLADLVNAKLDPSKGDVKRIDEDLERIAKVNKKDAVIAGKRYILTTATYSISMRERRRQAGLRIPAYRKERNMPS